MNNDEVEIRHDISPIRKSHGDGTFRREDFSRIGNGVIFESGVMVFHPENIELGNNIYVGHGAILKGYYKNRMQIGDDTWIGLNCFLHSGGGIRLGRCVGLGPGVMILSHQHIEEELDKSMLITEQEYKEVVIEEGCNIGIGSIVLPGVLIGKGSIVGAGSVVTRSVEPYSVVAGNPARLLRKRTKL